jgi:xylan 1,4-beta-xylosidase
MTIDYAALPRAEVNVSAQEERGPLEVWRAALGHGGINYFPLPDHVVEGVRRLAPRLIRVFLQEHFAVYPERGRFDWSRLDPFLDSFARTGAQVVAAICLKPPLLYPKVDPSIWRPTDWAEWQHVIRALVTRYSVEKRIVSYWEVGNETDIGESGGCPYLIPDPDDYFEYYRQTIAPALEASPQAKVGGPASCWITNEPLPGLIARCAQTGTRLDFISWHRYHDDPQSHAWGTRKAKELLAGFPGRRPEMLVTEWSKSFDPVSAEDVAFSSRRAANIAAGALAMLDAGLDWSFYYHIWDQTFYPDPFRSFFSDHGLALMIEHWNQVPHRFGLFGVSEEVRPQYFVFWLLKRLGDTRLAATASASDLHLLAGRGEGRSAAFLANFDLQHSRDLMVTVRFHGLTPGVKMLRTYRIDDTSPWDPEALDLLPLEQREVCVEPDFRCGLHLPADSVALIALEDR